MRSIMSALLLGVTLSACPAIFAQVEEQQDPAIKRLETSPRHHEWVDIAAGEKRKLRAFVVFPEVETPVLAVVIIHENRGLTDWVRSVADQVAEAGYLAVAPDFLSGMAPEGGGTQDFPSSDAAREAIYKLPQEQVLSDLNAAVDYARQLEASSAKVAVAGFCWGGGQAFRYAAERPKIAAAFVFYGAAPAEDLLKQIEVPVYGFYGQSDFRITGAVPKVQEFMKSRNLRYEPAIYAGAGHGFLRAGELRDASDANRDAMKRAWERWKEILSKL